MHVHAWHQEVPNVTKHVSQPALLFGGLNPTLGQQTVWPPDTTSNNTLNHPLLMLQIRFLQQAPPTTTEVDSPSCLQTTLLTTQPVMSSFEASVKDILIAPHNRSAFITKVILGLHGAKGGTSQDCRTTGENLDLTLRHLLALLRHQLLPAPWAAITSRPRAFASMAICGGLAARSPVKPYFVEHT